MPKGKDRLAPEKEHGLDQQQIQCVNDNGSSTGSSIVHSSWTHPSDQSRYYNEDIDILLDNGSIL